MFRHKSPRTDVLPALWLGLGIPGDSAVKVQRDGFVFTTQLGAPLGTNIHEEWAKLLREADGGK